MVRLAIPFLLAAGLAGGLAFAQSSASDEARAIAQAKQEAQDAAARSKKLEQQSKSATDEAARARAESFAMAARIEASEADITAAETQVRMIEQKRAEQRVRLAERQEPMARLVASLQTIGRRPPALALVQPGSLDDMIHIRALLASTLPVVRARTAALREEMETGERLRAQAEHAVAGLRASREQLAARRTALARFEADQRRRSQGLAESALYQSDRALALTEEARDISAEFGQRQYQARLRSELAELPGPVLRPTSAGPAPAPPISLPYRLPVSGRLIEGTGEISDSGVHSRGLTFSTGPSEAVFAPADGRIIYAGPFRTYGSIVIVDHGAGWTSLVTNMNHLYVAVGSEVHLGDMLGRTGPGSTPVTVELRHDGRPVPIAPLLALG
jgi:septal ring factor EnvC (AmiA/AmiB activator)